MTNNKIRRVILTTGATQGVMCYVSNAALYAQNAFCAITRPLGHNETI